MLILAMLPIALCQDHMCAYCLIAVQPDFSFAFVRMQKALLLTFICGCQDTMFLLQIGLNTVIH